MHLFKSFERNVFENNNFDNVFYRCEKKNVFGDF